MTNGIDLFAGGGGTTEGATAAGVKILWAANHKQSVVDTHMINHPNTLHSCQDLQQADWSLVPKHDILYASPCCQAHSLAAGAARNSLKADLSRSTAWAVVSCLEAHRSKGALIENVPEFLSWILFPAWKMAIEALNYSLSFNLVNLAPLGGPQNRKRLIIAITPSKNPIELELPDREIGTARSIVDLSMEPYKWDDVSNRVKATQLRVANGRKKYGEVFLDASYGSARCGRSLDKPLGTVTTINKHSLVIGDKIRPLSLSELSLAQTFSPNYVWPKGKTLSKAMIGNAVPPLMAKEVTLAFLRAA